MEKYAHKIDDKVQTVKEHSEGTAELARKNAVPLFKDIAHAAGLAHDIGKYSDAFQSRINGGKNKFEHSACGAMEYKELLTEKTDQLFAPMLEFCIACHHTGLQDGGSIMNARAARIPDGTMQSRIYDGRKEKEYTGDWDYSGYKAEITLEKPDFSDLFGHLSGCTDMCGLIELYAFFTRYLFSCLTDADFINTERFCKPDAERGFSVDFKSALEHLDRKLDSMTAETPLQKARSEMQRQAYENAAEKSEISILNMPTGSGKTFCSLKLALQRLTAEGSKERIIYVIPYTGIIEQTANEFEPIFNGSEGILQHHSNYCFDSDTQNGEGCAAAEKLRRACENWDAPIIITTAVQFFESVCHYRSSALRKLHNMANSVIVFDEIHTLPPECLQPCLRAVGYITKYLNSDAIFLSATMPDYSELFKKYAPECKLNELIRDKSDFKYFKKADFINLGRTDFETIAMKASEYAASLIIVNSKKSARKMYELASGNKYHLSAYMTPFDREKTIKKIKEDLNGGKEITVVSTSLIEAGIDLDFETVFREINGLDSILQAGGRCNREGKREKGSVYIFETENSNRRNDMRINAAKHLLENYDDITETECIEKYYNEIFFFNERKIEENTIGSGVKNPGEIPFETYAKKFSLIRDETIGVVVPQDELCGKYLEDLKNGGKNALRNLQRYTVPLKSSEFSECLNRGVIADTGYGVFKVVNNDYYDGHTGLDPEKNIDASCII